MSLQPHAIIGVDRLAFVTLLYVPLHDVAQEIMNTATSNKYLLALPDITVVQSVMQNAPSLLKYSERELYMLSNALQF